MTDPSPDTPFIVRRRVIWRDCDPAEIVYTPRFLDFVAEAVEGWFAHALGHDWYGFRKARNVQIPAVHASLDFASPVRSGDELTLSVLAGAVGRSSMPFDVVGRVGDRYAFRGKWIIALLDEGGRPISVPDDIRGLIARYREACEQAGLDTGPA